MSIFTRGGVLLLVMLASACGSDATTRPSPSPTPTPLPTLSPDPAPPAVAGVSFSPATMDVSSRAAVTTVSVHVTDAGTGVRELRVFLTAPTNDRSACGAENIPPQSGTINDGTWTCQITVPAGSPAGVWRLSQVDVSDNAFNSSVVSGVDAARLADGVTVIDSAPDTAPPVVVDVSFSPATVDVSLGAATTTASVHITDTGTGVSKFHVYLVGPTNGLLGCGAATVPPQSGTINDGTWTCQITVPAGSVAGLWQLAEIDASDNVFNSSEVIGGDAVRLADGVTVISR